MTLRRSLHPLQAIFLAFPLPMFLAGWLSDFVYSRTYEVQWLNFASWLIAGGLLVGAFALLWALVALPGHRTEARTARLTHTLALAAMWLLGLINAFVHARDAWATMPAGLYLSAIVTLLALLASWVGYRGFREIEP